MSGMRVPLSKLGVYFFLHSLFDVFIFLLVKYCCVEISISVNHRNISLRKSENRKHVRNTTLYLDI